MILPPRPIVEPEIADSSALNSIGRPTQMIIYNMHTPRQFEVEKPTARNKWANRTGGIQ